MSTPPYDPREPHPQPHQPYGWYPQAQPEQPIESAQPPQHGTGRRAASPLVLAAVVAAVVGAGTALGTVSLMGPRSVNSGISVTNETAAPAAKLDGTVAAAAAHIQPSVVTIQVSGQQEQGTGSGVVIRSDGYVLTNDHVVSVAAGGGTITVQTSDGRSAKAQVIGESSDDLAVVRVNLPNLSAATFGRSANLTVGQSVVAVGAPLGLSDTVTSGIVSATMRPVRAGDQGQAVFSAIQTDAAINPGNSGGPLVDLNGSVVGINSAIATASSGGGGLGQSQSQSGNIGIGFAIPSDEATRIANQLITTGKATHAVLDVSVSAQQPATTTGAVLQSVGSNGAAAKAGLQPGDIVIKVDNQRVQDGDGLIAVIHAPGDTVTVTYLRGGPSGHTSTAKVTLGTAAS